MLLRKVYLSFTYYSQGHIHNVDKDDIKLIN
jgi:hypothetical protein